MNIIYDGVKVVDKKASFIDAATILCIMTFSTKKH
jgi:hypothetical protein